MTNLPRLLLIAGTGRNTGKTTLACAVIRKFALLKSIISVKITPHFHKNIKSGMVLTDDPNLYIAEETDPTTGKDSSMMLEAGASHSYFVMTTDEHVQEAFCKIVELFPPDSLIICESGGLRLHTNPGLFFMMQKKETETIKPTAEKLMLLADHVITFDGEKIDFDPDRIEIEDNHWTLKHQ